MPKCCNKIQHKTLEGILTEKIPNINRIINNIKKMFFFLCIYKMYLISTEGYKNAKAYHLKIRKTGEIWVSMKHVGDGLSVTNITYF